MEIRDKVVWITGASSGIGEALTYASVEAGAKVIISARRVEELNRVKSQCGARQDRVFIEPMDLAQLDDIENRVKEWAEKLGRIDILINNGGISQRAETHETPLSVDRRIMEVNYFGQITLTKAVLPYMMSQKSGHIAIITSISGKFGFPLRSAYAASKHALHGFFESLMLEQTDTGVGVTLVNPGRIKTNISLNALTKDGTAHGEMDPGQEKGISAEACAQAILKAIRKNKPEVNIGKGDIALVYLKRYVPGIFRWIARRVSAK
ncbi:UNVERIFIED_CONTAM: hypothetical protein GTU68_040891 [Idotea baltica]|nr:hypothetical protein [Idotea baltica]